jgi:hypothetical protein
MMKAHTIENSQAQRGLGNYSLIARGSTFNAFGPTPDRILKRGTLQAVQRSFDKFNGAARIIDGAGNVIDRKFA